MWMLKMMRQVLMVGNQSYNKETGRSQFTLWSAVRAHLTYDNPDPIISFCYIPAYTDNDDDDEDDEDYEL